MDVPVQAFIVTNKGGNPDEIMGVKVIEMSSLEKKGNIGIIVALKRQFREEVTPLLEEKGFKNLTYFPY